MGGIGLIRDLHFYRNGFIPILSYVFFDIKTQLSFAREKLWLIFVDLAISKDVVNKTGERKTRFCSDNTNCSDKGTMHGSFNEAEDVFHAASTL